MPTAVRGSIWIAAPLFLLALLVWFIRSDPESIPPADPESLSAASALAFEENLGQGPVDAPLLARGPGLSAAVGSDFLRVRSHDEQFELRFLGADSSAAAALDQPVGSVSYLRGRDSKEWIYGAARGRRATFSDVYPGVDLDYYAAGSELEYDFVLEPGADPSLLRMQLEGEGRPRILDSGELQLSSLHSLHPPVAYQIGDDGDRTPVRSGYLELADGSIGFDLGPYDVSRTLVIDPRVGLSSYLGGAGRDQIQAVEAAPDGSLWVAGLTDSPDFPQPAGAFPYVPRGGLDVVITRLERGVTPFGEVGWRVASSVFLGGDQDDRAVDVELDADGDLHVFGDTRSTDFPITTDGLQRDLRGGADLFYAVLRETDFPFFSLGKTPPVGQSNPTNYELAYGTLVGGTEDDLAQHGLLAPFAPAPADRCAVLVGVSDSDDFPVTVFPAQPSRAGAADGAVTVLCKTPGEDRIERTYATYFGGPREDADARAAVAPDGSFCLGIRTSSDDLPAQNGVQTEPGGNTDAYLACFTPIRRRFGQPFLYRELGRTYFGGFGSESLHGLEIESTGPPVGLDPSFRVLALLESNGEDLIAPASLPAPPPGAFRENPGSRSILVAAFSQFLNSQQLHFWVGGGTAESVQDMAYSDGCLVLGGRTSSADLPLSSTFPQRQIAGGAEALAAKFCFNQDFSSATTEYLGFYGSSASDSVSAVAALESGSEVFVGALEIEGFGIAEGPVRTPQTGPGWPLSPGAPQRFFGGGASDGFVFELFRPRLSPQAVVNSADFSSGAVAPGEILSLFGAGIGPEELVVAQADPEGRLPRQLGLTRVLFNDAPAAMLFAGPNQVSAVAPFFLDGQSSVVLQVEVDGAPSLPITVPVVPTRPAVFTLNQTGSGQAAVLNQDFSVNGPQNGAVAGSVIQIFMTGAGQTAPPGVDGELVPLRQPFPRVLAPVTVRVGGVEAQVIYQGAAPGLVNGLTQVNVILSRELGSNPAATLEMTVGGVEIQPSATVAVR